MNYLNGRRLWKGFWQLADPKIWVASTIPVIVGGAFAYSSTRQFSAYWFIISLMALYLIEIGKNAVNEFIDYSSGVDRYVEAEKRTPFSGGKKTIVDGILTEFETVVIAALTLGVACAIGLYIMVFREIHIFWIGFAGVLLSVFYSMPPFKLAYRGWGEITVGLTFGPLVLMGIYLVMTHTLSLYALMVSMPIGILISNVLLINQFPDYEADLKGNKRNWVVRLGKEKSIRLHAALFVAAYLCLAVIGAVLRNPVWLIGYAGIPLAVDSVRNAKANHSHIPALLKSNANTVIVYQVTGAAMTVAALSGLFI